jgi:hypothetical protein
MERRTHVLQAVCLATAMAVAVSLAVTADSLSAEQTAQEIQQAIEAAGAEWTAGVTWVSRLSADEQAALCGDLYEEIPDEAKRRVPVRAGALPTHFDWHDNLGDWTSPIRNQGSCGSCWDFAATAIFESLLNIDAGNPALDPDLSEQYVLSCCSDCGSCGGGYSNRALDFYRTTGGVTEACLPYQADDSVPCGDACSETHVYLGEWAYIREDVETIKRAIYYYGPISASFEVYQDFSSYTGGIYEHVWGSYRGGHAISIVGWDHAEQYWICKNSWGASWGEVGFFRIRWGECNIEGRRTVMATLGSWPNGVVNATVLDNTGTGLAGVDVYVDGDWYGTTGAGGTLLLDLIADMTYTITAEGRDVFLYGDIVAPGSLTLDCRAASAVTVNAVQLNGDPLEATVYFDYGSRPWSPGYTSGGSQTFYVTPGTYDLQAHDWSSGDEYALFEFGLDCTNSCTCTMDTRTMPMATIHLQTVDMFHRWRLCLEHDVFDWYVDHTWLYAGQSLYCSAGYYTLRSYLADDTFDPPYRWYYRLRDEDVSLAVGSTLNLQGGGALDAWTAFDPGHYKQGDRVWIWCGLSDAYGNSFQYVYRYDDSSVAGSLDHPDRDESLGGDFVYQHEGSGVGGRLDGDPRDEPGLGELAERTSGDLSDSATSVYYDPELIVDSPSDVLVAYGVVPLDTWVYFTLDSDAETGLYETTMVFPSHVGDITDVSYFPVDRMSTAAVFRVDEYGDVLVDGTVHASEFLSGNADVAEWVTVSEAVEPGDVLELDPSNPGQYRKARGPCSPLIAGVVSSDPGVVLGSGAPSPSATHRLPLTTYHSHSQALLALIGIVPVKACDEGGPIEPGDLLVTASRSGYVSRCKPGECAFIVGKAMGLLISGEGLILVLLTR